MNGQERDRFAGAVLAALPAARVINLAASTARLAGIAARLDAAGLAWRRHEAEAPVSAEAARAHPLYRGARARALFGRDLNRGEIGCYLSHMAAMRAALDEGAASALILEDDAVPLPGAGQALAALLARLAAPAGPPVEWLGLCRTLGKWGVPLEEVAGHRLLRAWRPPLIASAILWTRPGMERFLAHVARHGIDRPVDDAMRACFARAGTAAVLARPVFSEDGSDSTIDPQNARHSGQNKLTRMRRKLPDYFWASVNRLRGG